MTRPPNGGGGPKAPDTTSHQGDQLDQDLDLALQRNPQVEHITSLSGWPALAAWLKANR